MRYSAKVLKYFYNCQHALTGPVEPGYLCGEAGVLANGDFLQVFIKPDQGSFQKIHYKIQAGVATMACMEFVARQLISQPLTQLDTLSAEQILFQLQLPTTRMNSALLPLAALGSALKTDEASYG